MEKKHSWNEIPSRNRLTRSQLWRSSSALDQSPTVPLSSISPNIYAHHNHFPNPVSSPNNSPVHSYEMTTGHRPYSSPLPQQPLFDKTYWKPRPSPVHGSNCNNNRIRQKKKLSRKFLAMDCEMVGVGKGGRHSVLARVVMVDWNRQVVLDAYVRPVEQVTDYRTFVSGITEKDLYGPNATNLGVCRSKVLALLKGSNNILVGHGLENDLKALGIIYPWYLTRDTAKWVPFMKMQYYSQDRPDNCNFYYKSCKPNALFQPRKLKELCYENLNREIQVWGKPHDPVEDATAALDLYKTFQFQWDDAVAVQVNQTRETEQKMLWLQQQLGQQRSLRYQQVQQNHQQQRYTTRR